MHEDDGDGVDAVIARLVMLAPRAIEIGHALDGAVGAHPFVDLDDALIELLGKDDLLGEDVGPRLVGDAQRVAKALVISSSTRSPLRSSSALVATVVPILMSPIRPAGIGAPAPRPSSSRMPWMAASR